MSAREMLVQGGRFYRMLIHAVLLLLILNVVRGIDYDSFRNDEEPKMIKRRNNRPLRRYLENELNETPDYKNTYTVQEGTEVLLHFGTLLRYQMLDVLGSIIFEHYEDFSLRQVEALFRIYDETMKRKYNIFEIVPSVLKYRDLRPSSLCKYIHLHVRTCLKETARNCMKLRKHDQAKLRTQFAGALNYTNYVYKKGRLHELYPDVFFMNMIVRHLQQGMLTLNDKLLAGLLNHIQYDEYDERVREAEKQTVRHLLSSRYATRRNNTRRSLSAFQVSRFYAIAPLVRYYLQVNWHTFPEPIAHKVHFLAQHVIKHVGSINSNIELLGTVYEGNIFHLKYLFDLVIPSDIVDPDVASAKDYLLRKVTALRIVDKFLRIEKYQQSGPEQLFMETMQQLMDIGFAKDIAMALHVHAQFWHRSVVVESLKDLLLLFDAYENLRTVTEHKRFILVIDSIRERLWNAKNVTIDIICNNPRACLRLGLEVVLKCDLVSVEIKNWILLYFDFVNNRGSLMLEVCNGPRENIWTTASTSLAATKPTTSVERLATAKVMKTMTQLSTVTTESEKIAPEAEITSAPTTESVEIVPEAGITSAPTTESVEIVPEAEITSAPTTESVEIVQEPEITSAPTTESVEEMTDVTIITTEIPTKTPVVAIGTNVISTTTTSKSYVVTTPAPVVTKPQLTTTELPIIIETTTAENPITEPPSIVTTYDQEETIIPDMAHHDTIQPIVDREKIAGEAVTVTLPTTDGIETTTTNCTTTEKTKTTITLTAVPIGSTTSPLIVANKTSKPVRHEETLLKETIEITEQSSEASSKGVTTTNPPSVTISVTPSTIKKIVKPIPAKAETPRPTEVVNVTSGISKVIDIDNNATKLFTPKLNKAVLATTKASCEDSGNCSDECSDENCSGSEGCVGPNCPAECSGEDCSCADCETEESKECVGPQCQPPVVGCPGGDCNADSSSEECAEGKNCQNDSSSCSGDDCSKSESAECTSGDCMKIPSNQIKQNTDVPKNKDVVVMCHNRNPHHQRKKKRMQKMQRKIVNQKSPSTLHSLIPVNITDKNGKDLSLLKPLTKPVYFEPVYNPWHSNRPSYPARPLYPLYPPMRGHPASFYADISGNLNKNHNKNTNINQNWNYVQLRRHQVHDVPEMQEHNISPVVRVSHHLDSYPDK
ncbi:uncharacterized protein LOC107274290 [Cephus cinctus]|uniref:Uncharacterized protein LOC107274290 n=1 Tax=Cephus cinctus TaxID=211228 RepID=A0AAJ7FUE1_CEPCN|nr:uncharacterized protein LOC107274290 [Cephus cinctus]